MFKIIYHIDFKFAVWYIVAKWWKLPFGPRVTT